MHCFQAKKLLCDIKMITDTPNKYSELRTVSGIGTLIECNRVCTVFAFLVELHINIVCKLNNTFGYRVCGKADVIKQTGEVAGAVLQSPEIVSKKDEGRVLNLPPPLPTCYTETVSEDEGRPPPPACTPSTDCTAAKVPSDL
ncbi:hypothetical protein SKAU_G00095330 [Synaphobranchus kaupii]|uniref:Uncharacterized protein n=1 Tax=Synaphobranchus kaupii TaxID=118154 RepID=A0A9Q1FYD9_SYNKA|nr:hypothetical protein SKAU_G00095330 [Synaphobranchus kaupii]